MALNRRTSMPATDKIPTGKSTEGPLNREDYLPTSDDGTGALLTAGSWITLAGMLAMIATKTLLGGIGIDGPHTNSGWLAFMFAMMGIPFGLMLLVLGAAKWMRNRRLRLR